MYRNIKDYFSNMSGVKASDSLIRAATHLVLEDEPLTPSELKEIVIRHILSCPYDKNCAATTRSLLDAYLACCDLNGHPAGTLPTKTDAARKYKEAFVEGFRYVRESGADPNAPPEDFYLWPTCIPDDCISGYPVEILVTIGNTLGYKVGMDQANKRRETIPQGLRDSN